MSITRTTLLPLPYLVAAAIAYVAAAAGVAWLGPELAGHYYQPRILALTHTLTLGWITMSIMGASCQLVPVALERPLWSPRLARWQFVIFLVGVVGMVGHFFIGQWSGLAWSAALVGIACVMHVLNVVLSVRDLPRWHFTARLVMIALAGLVLTVVFGFALAADKIWRFMPPSLFLNLHAHAHVALLAWVAPMIIGVGARVYPMFLLAPEPKGWLARVQVWGIVLGTVGVTAGLLTDRAVLTIAGALAASAALTGHLVWLVQMIRRRKRPQLDRGLRLVVTAAAFLPVAIALGLGFALDVIQGPRMALAYAVVVIGGWVSLTIAGMMLKIVPFLVWYRVYAPVAGKAPVPSLTDLSPAWAERAAYVLLTAGTVALAIFAGLGDAAGIRVSGVVLTGGALAFGAALGAPLRLMRRRGRPSGATGPLLIVGGKRSA